MQVYLVGGAIRDGLLGLPVRERDWVVVGATRDALLHLGYREVGRDFPVFLHPVTHEEYALARLERKVAPGYRGFEFRFGPEVTLEQDLGRRDLTINAIAQGEDGALVDPCGGRADLDARILRHVSAAFVEDPVRVLRVARFAARFAPQGFRVAAETMDLMRSIVARGEVDALVPERIWQETDKALASPAPAVFFRVLRECGALRVVYPELEARFEYSLLALERATQLAPTACVRFAALVHDLGSVAQLDGLAQRLRIPNDYRELALIVTRYHDIVHRALELPPQAVLEFLEKADAFRRPARFAQALVACEACWRAPSGFEGRAYPQHDYLAAAREAAAAIRPIAVDMAGRDGTQIAAQLRGQRLHALARLRARYPPS